MKYRVVKPYKAAFSDHLVIDKGEELRFERKPTDWQGWIWCTAEGRGSAWVPEAWAEIRGEFCVLLRDYSSRELSVSPGELLDVKLTESEWVWVRNERAEEGWIPADRIEPA